MKRLLTLIMAAAILFSLAAWASAETPSTEKQLQFLSENLNSISQQETASPWYYAITDFDHNGLLEAVAVSADGYSTNVLAWEVDAAASGLKKCGFLLGKDESYPDILTDSVDTYHYEDDDKWYYVFSDAINNAGSFNRNKCSITLLGGNFIYKLYATESSEFLNGLTVITFSDAEGKMITPDVYESAEKSALAGAKKSSSSFGWFKMDASTGLQTLTDSFAVFMGEKAPDDNSVIHEYDELLQESQNSVPEVSEPEAEPIPEEQAPASEYPEGVFEYTAPDVEVFYYDGNNGAGTSGKTENFTKPSAAQNGSNGENEIFYIDQPSSPVEVFIPTPAPTPKPVYLSVTRNPTNELRKPGDTARFVACANAIDSLQWSFVSPDGSSISASEFANRFPGSSVDGSSTTLSISNVSADMGGWGAYCTFRTNDGQSVTTSTAYIIMK
ncbi:MAG: hypothetical protein Q4F31_04525 [Eubacteriales bacterium]|nr:hypothetical protein [Eubacteriales bacterium]